MLSLQEMHVSDIRGNVLRDKTLNLVDKDSEAIAFGKNVDSDMEGLSRGSSIVQNGEISEDETSGFSKDKKDATDKVPDEFLKQKEFFSGHLLPTQVCLSHCYTGDYVRCLHVSP